MTKRKKLAKTALKTPEMYSPGELAYFKMWLNERKRMKAGKKRDKETPELDSPTS